MNARTRQAALRIQLLMEEYTSQELNDAIVLIGGKSEEGLLHFLERTKAPTRPPSSMIRGGKGTSPADPLEAIRDSEPEKYRVLREFETQLLQGECLPTLHDVRTFGQSLDKEFDPGKTRHDGLRRLLRMLSKHGLDGLREAIRRAPVSNVNETDAFIRLSRHLISGASDSERRPE